MDRIDQFAQIVRMSVAAVGSKKHRSVVAPVSFSGKSGDRHQFNRGDAEFDERIEPFDSAEKRAFRSESADVQLVNDRFAQWNSFPFRDFPTIGTGIDD